MEKYLDEKYFEDIKKYLCQQCLENLLYGTQVGKEMFVVVGEINIKKIKLTVLRIKRFIFKIFKGSLHSILKGT